jgi:hypothetical protein
MAEKPGGDAMIPFERARELLSDVVDTLPPEIFTDLNGGVILRPEAPVHPGAKDGGLRVMGRYNYQPAGLGRFIQIFYGSFARLYPHAPERVWREKLSEVLRHELTHHLENMAGEDDLEVEDAQRIAEYNADRD